MTPHESKPILKDLSAIQDRLTSISESLHEANPAIAEYAKAAKDANDATLRQPAVPIRSETDLSPRVIQAYESHEDSSYRLQRKSYRVGLITLIVLGIYTIATWWLAKTSRDSLKATNDSFAQTLCQKKA